MLGVIHHFSKCGALLNVKRLKEGIRITTKSEKLNKQKYSFMSEIANPRICDKLAGGNKRNK